MRDFLDRLFSCNILSSLLKTTRIADSRPTAILIGNIFRNILPRAVNSANVTFDYSDNILLVNDYTPIKRPISLKN